MAFKNYCSCHTHIASLDSASTPEAFVKREVELETGAVACTDHGTMGIHPQLYKLAKENSLIPILGIEAYLRDPKDELLVRAGVDPAEYQKFGGKEQKYTHITLHAQDYQAYEILIQEVSKADARSEQHGSERKPLFSWESLERLGGYNVTAGSSCLIGTVARHLMVGRPDIAQAYYERLRSTFKPGKFFAEVFARPATHNYVSGVFLALEGAAEEKRFWDRKKLKTSEAGEIYAEDLAKLAAKGKKLGLLVGVMNNRKWEEVPPQVIVGCRKVNEFVPNDCSPDNPTGDLQLTANKFVIDLANKYGDRIQPSGDDHYAYPDDQLVQDSRLMSQGWKMHSCFERSSLVDMADGTRKRICEIAIGDMVLSYDFNGGGVVSAKVSNVFKSNSTAAEFMRLRIAGVGSSGSQHSLMCTRDHRIYSADGWVRADQTTAPMVRAKSFSVEEIEAIEGTLLGDSCITLAGTRPKLYPYFMYTHCERQNQATEEIGRILEAKIHYRPAKFVPPQLNGKPINASPSSATSSAHPLFCDLKAKWYPQGKKIVPKSLKLTPRMAAWWFMDDGQYATAKRVSSVTGLPRVPSEYYRFYTNGFTIADADFLVARLSLDLGIRASRLIRDGQPYIQLCKSEGRKLEKIIAPHLLSCFRYKTSGEHTEEYQRPPASKYREDIFGGPNAFEAPIAKTYNNLKIDLSQKWDIEVEGQHCFFVNGILVHNSYARQSSDEAFRFLQASLGTTEKEFEGWVENSREWAQSFKDFTFPQVKSLPSKFYPSDTLTHVKTLIDKQGRMDWSDPVRVARLKSEIDLLHFNGVNDFLSYFFMSAEANEYAESKRVLTGVGRGSSGGMYLAYLLGIVHLDALRWGLSQDRFMTKVRIESGSLPDIDSDFANRDVLLDPEDGWLFKRFGNHAAAISTKTMLRLKSSIKDVVRHKRGEVPADILKMVKDFENVPQGVEDVDFIFGYTGDDGKEVRGFFDESKELQQYAKDFPEEWELVKKFLGIQRGSSRHASGYVVADRPISEFIPTTTISGVPTTQFDAEGVEFMGGVKMDFLGLKNLEYIQDAIELIQKRNGGVIFEDHFIDGKRVPGLRVLPLNGRFVDIWDLPANQSVFNDIASGNTETVFQLSTASAKRWLSQFNYEKSPGVKAIDSIDAVAAFTALDRPGPLDAYVEDPRTKKRHNMLVEYANRLKGLPAVGEIPALKELLPETYSILVYQEQLESVFREISGCSAAEAEEFRRNVAKKKMDKIKKAYPSFIERATERFGAEQAQQVWDQLVTFGQYGFCKAHSYEYGLTAYACAFLKHHFNTEWWCAVLKTSPKDKIIEKFWKHCSHLVDQPDIRFSGEHFQIVNERIRAPLSFLKGVGPGAHAELTEYRPIESMADLCLKINKRRLANAKPAVNKDGTPKLDKAGNQVLKLGGTALNSGVVSKLIVSGVADSLFPPEMPIVDRLQLFEDELARTYVEVNGGKKNPKAPNEKYCNLTALSRYQLQKEILPIYSEDVQQLVCNIGFHGFKQSDARQGHFSYLPTDASEVADLLKQKGGRLYDSPVPVVNGGQLKFLDTVPMDEGDNLVAAAVGFVVDERRFTYQKKVRCEALDLSVDIDGEQFSMVKWPDRNSGKLAAPAGPLIGSIVLIIASRYRNDRPFTLDVIKAIQKPLSDDASSSED